MFVTNTISESERRSMDEPISFAELFTTANQMKKGRVPGPDGVPLEFYITFWEHVGPLIHEILLEGLQIDQFHVRIVKGHIVLIPKKGNQFLVSNKRPLTLLNVVYKIWAKPYQLRLSKVLNRFISYHQSAFLPGRSIHHSVLLLNEILHRAALSGLDFALLKLDICKAFDKTEWDFLIALLEHIGFGPNFIRFITATMANATFAVIINGHQSDPLKITHSMRQGCPLSPLLFEGT